MTIDKIIEEFEYNFDSNNFFSNPKTFLGGVGCSNDGEWYEMDKIKNFLKSSIQSLLDEKIKEIEKLPTVNEDLWVFRPAVINILKK